MLEIKQRHLPHFTLESSTYFVTWRLFREQGILADTEKDMIVSSLRFFDDSRYKLLAFVVMDDHVHVLFTPLVNMKLSQILHTWKSFTAHELMKSLDRNAPIWQHESFDHIIRNDADLTEKLGYITTNPLRKWHDISDYRWVWSVFDT